LEPGVLAISVADSTAGEPEARQYLQQAGEKLRQEGVSSVLDRAVAVAQQGFPPALGLLAGAGQLVRRALELVQQDSHDAGRLLTAYSNFVYREENDFEAARDAYTRALAVAHRENDTELEVRTLGNAANVLAFHGHYHESLEMRSRGLELARRVDDPSNEFIVLIQSATVLLLTGDLQGVKPHLESLRQLAEKLRHRGFLVPHIGRVCRRPSTKAIGRWLAIISTRHGGIAH